MKLLRKTKSTANDLNNPIIWVGGYIRPENDHYTAICINLNLVAQGDNIDDAFKNLLSSMHEYLQFIVKNYPNKWQEVISAIEPPKEFIEEMNEISERINQQVSLSASRQINGKEDLPTIIGRTFAETIPTAFAH